MAALAPECKPPRVRAVTSEQEPAHEHVDRSSGNEQPDYSAEGMGPTMKESSKIFMEISRDNLEAELTQQAELKGAKKTPVSRTVNMNPNLNANIFRGLD